MATYFEMFGMPDSSEHIIKRMNEVGISPAQLTAALASQARPGTSPGTIMFIAGGVTVTVDEITGKLVTIW
jgi:hypothetical protein